MQLAARRAPRPPQPFIAPPCVQGQREMPPGYTEQKSSAPPAPAAAPAAARGAPAGAAGTYSGPASMSIVPGTAMPATMSLVPEGLEDTVDVTVEDEQEESEPSGKRKRDDSAPLGSPQQRVRMN